MIGALASPAKQGTDPTNTLGLSQEWRRLNVSFMYNPYYTLCAQHISAPPPEIAQLWPCYVCQPYHHFRVMSHYLMPFRPLGHVLMLCNFDMQIGFGGFMLFIT